MLVAAPDPERNPNDKAAWRAAFEARRRAVPAARRAPLARAAADLVLAIARERGAAVVALYAPIGAELDTQPLAFGLLAQGCRLAYPRGRTDGTLEMAFAASPGDLRPRPGTRLLEPVTPALDLAELDLVVAPAMGLDLHGTRLGRGGGHYDRLLASPALRAHRVGLTWASCVVARLPREAHDVAMDAIVAETGRLDVRA